MEHLPVQYRLLWEVKKSVYNNETLQNENVWREQSQHYQNKMQVMQAAESMAKNDENCRNLKLQELGPVKTWKLEYEPPIKLVELEEEDEDNSKDKE